MLLRTAAAVPGAAAPRGTSASFALLAALVTFGAAAVPLAAQSTGSQQAVTEAPVAARPDTVRGVVVDAVTRAHVSDAVITVAHDGAAQWALRTTPDGRWYLALGRSTGTLVFHTRRLGYRPASTTLRLDGDTAAMRHVVIVLEPVPLVLGTQVVTAARRDQALKDTPVPTRIVSHEQIARSGGSDLARVLDEQVGVAPAAGTPSGSGVLLQGLGQQRVLILMDGQPVEGRISGTFDLSRIPTAAVDHVEIVEGPQSTLYGSDAMGGVINIITARGRLGTTRTSADLVGGSAGRLDASAQIRGGMGPVRYAGTVGRRTISLTPGRAAADGAHSRRWDAIGSAHWGRDSAFAVETGALLIAESQAWRSGPSTFSARNLQWGAHTGARWQWHGQTFAPTLAISEFDHRPATIGADGAIVTGSNEREVQRRVTAQFLYTAAVGAATLDAGVDAHRETLASERVRGGHRATNTVEPFAQATLTAGALQVIPGARLSWSDQWDTHWSPRVAALYRPVPSLALRAALGEGFRAPDFKELYIDFLNTEPGAGYGVQGNPDLTPERSRNISASAEWAGDWVYLRLEGFDTRYRDFITTEYVGTTDGLMRFTYGNVDGGRIRGLEWTGGAVLHGVRLDGGYGLTRSTRDGSPDPLFGVPRTTARLGVSRALGAGPLVTLTGIQTGSAPIGQNRSGEGYVVQSAFTRFNVLLSQSLTGGFTVILGGDNVLDARPANWPEASRRRIYTGLRWAATLGHGGAAR